MGAIKELCVGSRCRPKSYLDEKMDVEEGMGVNEEYWHNVTHMLLPWYSVCCSFVAEKEIDISRDGTLKSLLQHGITVNERDGPSLR